MKTEVELQDEEKREVIRQLLENVKVGDWVKPIFADMVSAEISLPYKALEISSGKWIDGCLKAGACVTGSQLTHIPFEKRFIDIPEELKKQAVENSKLVIRKVLLEVLGVESAGYNKSKFKKIEFRGSH